MVGFYLFRVVNYVGKREKSKHKTTISANLPIHSYRYRAFLAHSSFLAPHTLLFCRRRAVMYQPFFHSFSYLVLNV
jgi:hypothetical protein